MTLQFSHKERHDLLVAWILVSVAAAIVLYRTPDREFGIYGTFLLAALTVGVGFIVHELAHKYVAQKYGKYAEFHAFLPMLAFAILLSFFGILFAAPGAVFISGYSTRREMGHIAIAGPLSNIALALLVLPLYFLIDGGFWGALIQFFYQINVWLALFNMIPLMMLDGAKIMAWSKRWYFATLAVCVALFVVQSLP